MNRIRQLLLDRVADTQQDRLLTLTLELEELRRRRELIHAPRELAQIDIAIAVTREGLAAWSDPSGTPRRLAELTDALR